MTPSEELDLILSLIRKYGLPLSPILEYAINEKKEEYTDTTTSDVVVPVIEEHINDVVEQIADSSTEEIESEDEKPEDGEEEIRLTYEIIEAARNPNGFFSKSQLEAIGINWPAPVGWIPRTVGKIITRSQLEAFYHIENPSPAKDSKPQNRRQELESVRKKAIIEALKYLGNPGTPQDIARTVDPTVWRGAIKESSIIQLLKEMPEVGKMGARHFYLLKPHSKSDPSSSDSEKKNNEVKEVKEKKKHRVVKKSPDTKDNYAFQWVKERLLEGWSYQEIIQEFNKLHKVEPELYSTKYGMPLSVAILSNWAKQVDPKLRPGNNAMAINWRQKSVGYKWVKEQLLAGISSDAIIEEFNARHEVDPEHYSTYLGLPLTMQTLERWKKDSYSL